MPLQAEHKRGRSVRALLMLLLLGASMTVQAAKPAKPASAANSQSAAALAALPIEEAVDLPPDASVPAAQRHSPAVEVKGAASEAALSRTQAVIEQQIKDDKNSATAEEDPPHHGQRSTPALCSCAFWPSSCT